MEHQNPNTGQPGQGGQHEQQGQGDQERVLPPNVEGLNMFARYTQAHMDATQTRIAQSNEIMQGLIGEVQRLHEKQEQQHADMATIATILQQQGAQPQQDGQQPRVILAPPTRPKSEVKFQTFRGGDVESYRRWEDHIGRAVAANGSEFPQTAHVILALMQDRAIDQTRTLNGNNYNSWQALKTELRKIFMSSAYRSQARAEWTKRIQKPDEDIGTFHGLLRSLRDDAFPEEQHSEEALIEKFIAGIRNKRTHASLHNLIIAEIGPDTYQRALEMALRAQSEYIIMDREIDARETGAKLEARTTKLNPPKPMDVGSITRKYCTVHNTTGHSNEQCYKQKGNTQNKNQVKKNSYSGGKVENKNNNKNDSKPTRSPGPNDRCGQCKGLGHWKRHCPSGEFLKNKQGKKNFKPHINAIHSGEEEFDGGNEPDIEEEEDAQSAGNSVWGTHQ